MEKIHFKVGEVYRMIRTVVLHGGLASFGGSYAVDVRSVREAVYALTTQIKGLYRAIRAGEFLVKADESISLDESELDFDLGRVSRIDIIPVPVGSKRQGLLKVILGVALIGVGFAVGLGTTISGGMLAGLSGKTFLMLGAGMFMSGIGQMLSPSPTADSNEKADERPSYLFSSPVNIAEEGNVVPLAYGAPYCSTLVISSGYSVEDVSITMEPVSGLSVSASSDGTYITAAWSALSGAADYVIRIGGEGASWESYDQQYTTSDTKVSKWLSEGKYTIMVKGRNGSTLSREAASVAFTVVREEEPDYGGGDGGDGGDGGE